MAMGILVMFFNIWALGGSMIQSLARMTLVSLLFASIIPINALSFWLWDDMRTRAMNSIQPTMNAASDELEILARDSSFVLLAGTGGGVGAHLVTRGTAKNRSSLYLERFPKHRQVA